MAADTITPNGSITHPETIISAGGRFELGFFSPKNDTNYYLGIWYKAFSPQTVVWVANREYPPCLSSSASLCLNSDGNLMISCGKMNYSVTTTSSSNTNNATLLDSGNLILINITSVTDISSRNTTSATLLNSQVLWQSFDYPTDTLLPGMKLGYDPLAGVSWSLVSWNSSQDPAPGVFSLVLDPRLERHQLNIEHDSKIYWTSDVRYFRVFYSAYRLWKNSTYVTWADNLGDSTISRILLDVSGQLKLQSRTEGAQGWNTLEASTCGISGCGSFSICNKSAQMPCVCLPGFNSSKSNDSSAQEPHETWAVGARCCVRKTVLGCSSNSSSRQDEDGFLRIENADFPINPQKLNVTSSMECKSASLRNCSWIAYAFDEINGSCFVWDNELFDLKKLMQGDINGRNFFLKLAASELNSLGKDFSSYIELNPRNGTQADPAYEKNTGNKKQLLIIVILTISLTVVTLSFIMLCLRRKLRRKGEDLLLFDLGTSPKADSAELTEENQLGKSMGHVDK
ncbi:hypothetical protein QYF36_018001 [Acer negundo]|nr:hypothetical protein QYF36_018001 [Acer negundo]